MQEWLRRRAWDWGPPAVLLAVGEWELWAGDPRLVGPAWAVALAVAVAAAALVVRRSRPIVAFLTVLAGIFLLLAGGVYAQSSALAYSLAVATYACGRYARRPTGYGAVPVAVVAILVAAAADPEETLASTWTWSLNAVWIFGLGAWLRQKSQLVEQARREGEERSRAATAEERVQIARELHDVLAHSLSVMVVQAEAADEIIGKDVAAARSALAHVQETGRAALGDTRRLLGLLRDPDADAPTAPLPDLGEVPALVERFRAAGLPVAVDVQVAAPVDDPISRAAYRVVQEALTNTLRHAGPVPTQVRVAHAQPDHLRVEVLDEGRAVPSQEGGGHGLIGMRERVEACGGVLETGPRPGGGFRVLARLPLPAVLLPGEVPV